MTLKNAALLALVGTVLVTALLTWTFVFDFVNVLRGLAPAATLVSTFIYAFACFTLAIFFSSSKEHSDQRRMIEIDPYGGYRGLHLCGGFRRVRSRQVRLPQATAIGELPG
jgi:hypothetical protein